MTRTKYIRFRYCSTRNHTGIVDVIGYTPVKEMERGRELMNSEWHWKLGKDGVRTVRGGFRLCRMEDGTEFVLSESKFWTEAEPLEEYGGGLGIRTPNGIRRVRGETLRVDVDGAVLEIVRRCL